jgi:hypothetical protein
MLRRTAAASLIIGLVGGCGPNISNVSPLEPELTLVLAQLDAKQFSAMYDEGSAELHTETQAAFITDLQRLDAQMGQCQAAVRTATNGPAATMSAEYEQVTYTRNCASGVWIVTIGVKGQYGKGQLNVYRAEPAPAGGNAADANTTNAT